MKILVIESSGDIVEALGLCLRARWPEATVVSSSHGEGGLDLLVRESPDLVILDLLLPDMDGLRVLKEIRSFSDVPVVILAAEDGVTEEVKGLEEGADDYIVKPFRPLEFLARVRAVLRRHQGMMGKEAHVPSFRADGLRIDFSAREVYLDEKQVHLAPREYALLCQLVKNAGRVVPYANLLKSVYGYGYDHNDILKTQVYRLRTKLGRRGRADGFIVNRRGQGYLFVRPDVTPTPGP